MIYSTGIYTKAEIAAAKPELSRLGGFPFAHCLTTRSDYLAYADWTTPSVAIVKFDELYAWNNYEPANVRFRWIG